MIEVMIPSVQHEVVLQNEGGEPHVIRWDGGPLFPELAKQRTVVMRRLLIGKERRDAFLQKERSQDVFVPLLPVSIGEAGAQLSENDVGKDDHFRLRKD
jgi:hypothetical protein